MAIIRNQRKQQQQQPLRFWTASTCFFVWSIIASIDGFTRTRSSSSLITFVFVAASNQTDFDDDDIFNATDFDDDEIVNATGFDDDYFFNRTDDDTSIRETDFEYMCQVLWDVFPGNDTGTSCECLEDVNNSEVTMACISPCYFCNLNGTVCLGEEDYGTTFNYVSGEYIVEWESYRYVRGGDRVGAETLHVAYDDGIGCIMTVDDTMTCESCEYVLCNDGTEGISVDCQNLQAGALFVDCEGDDGTPHESIDGTILEGLFAPGFHDCIFEMPTLTSSPTFSPGHVPSRFPSRSPSRAQSQSPTTDAPVASLATEGPSRSPSRSPTDVSATYLPTESSSTSPSRTPETLLPTVSNGAPSNDDSSVDESVRSSPPTASPVATPSKPPSTSPSHQPATLLPTASNGAPSTDDSYVDESVRSSPPTASPVATPSKPPSTSPSRQPATLLPTASNGAPSIDDSSADESVGSSPPTASPVAIPSQSPSIPPSRTPMTPAPISTNVTPSTSTPVGFAPPTASPVAIPSQPPSIPPSRTPMTPAPSLADETPSTSTPVGSAPPTAPAVVTPSQPLSISPSRTPTTPAPTPANETPSTSAPVGSSPPTASPVATPSQPLSISPSRTPMTPAPTPANEMPSTSTPVGSAPPTTPAVETPSQPLSISPSRTPMTPAPTPANETPSTSAPVGSSSPTASPVATPSRSSSLSPSHTPTTPAPTSTIGTPSTSAPVGSLPPTAAPVATPSKSSSLSPSRTPTTPAPTSTNEMPPTNAPASATPFQYPPPSPTSTPTTLTLVPSNGMPSIYAPTFPSPTTIPHRMCRTAMTSSDFNQDDKLDEAEYVRFLNRLTGNEFMGQSFEALDTVLQDNFRDLAGDIGQINIFGSKPGQSAFIKQEDFISRVCLDTATAISFLGEQTLGPVSDHPSLSPSELSIDSPLAFPSHTPVLFPSVSPTYAPSRSPTKSPTNGSSPVPSFSSPIPPIHPPSLPPIELPTDGSSPTPSFSSSGSPADLPSHSPTELPTVGSSPSPSPALADTPLHTPSVLPVELPTAESSPAPSLSSSLSPVSSPSLPLAEFPTNGFSSLPSPTLSSSPSASPVRPPPNEHQHCLSATEIHNDETLFGFLPPLIGTATSSSSISTMPITSGSENIFLIHEQNQEPLCGVPPSARRLEGEGAWYSFVGTGGSVRATTCFEGTTVRTSVVVFRGTCQDADDFRQLECIVGDYGKQSCGVSSNAATVTWLTEKNTIYYIWVTGHDIPSNGGNFEFSVGEFDLTPNDSCVNAVSIGLSSPPGALVQTGSTDNATRDFPYGSKCGVPLEHPGTWHRIEGIGSAITVSACTNVTNYQAAISVFEGSCDDLECVAGMDFTVDSCDFGIAGTVTWLAKPDTTYYIYVHGGGNYVSSVGSYGLTATESPVGEPNGFCQEAAAVPSDGMQVSGSTTNATRDGIGPTYCGVPTDAPGLWYKISGNGAAIQASTCSQEGNSSTAISVFTGPCHDLQCVTGQSFSSTCSSPDEAGASTSNLRHRSLQSNSTNARLSDSLSWLAEEGETYFVFVQGDLIEGGSSAGSFDLALITAPKSSFYCQKLLAEYKDDNYDDDRTTCDCTEAANGEISLKCTSSCLYCNNRFTVCLGEEAYGITVNATGDFVSEWESHRYVEGRDKETLLVEYMDTSTCRVTVNDTMTCSVCQVVSCIDGSQGIAVDCQNLEGGTFFVDCKGSLSPTLVEGTFLEGLFSDGFEKCETPQSVLALQEQPPAPAPPTSPTSTIPIPSVPAPTSIPEAIPTALPVGLSTRPPGGPPPSSTPALPLSGSLAIRANKVFLWMIPLGATFAMLGVTML